MRPSLASTHLVNNRKGRLAAFFIGVNIANYCYVALDLDYTADDQLSDPSFRC